MRGRRFLTQGSSWVVCGFRMRCASARRTSGPGAGPGAEPGPAHRTTSAQSGLISSAPSAPSAAPAPLGSYRPATPRPCKSISRRSPRLSLPVPTLSSSSIGPRLAHLHQVGGARQHRPHTPAGTGARAQPGAKHLAVPTSELALEPDLQELRRYCRSLLLCLERTHRPALDHHVHRTARLGRYSSTSMRVGISVNLLKEGTRVA